MFLEAGSLVEIDNGISCIILVSIAGCPFHAFHAGHLPAWMSAS